MGSFKTKTLATVTALSMIAAPMAAMTTSAQAGERHFRGHGGNTVIIQQQNGFHRKHHLQRKHHVQRKHRRNHVDGSTGLGIALGILGTAVVLDALNDSNKRAVAPTAPRYVPRDTYVAPHAFPPAPRAPSAVQYSSLEPWTPGWYRWCDNRYRSFNPDKGTYRGYDGRDHFCVPK